MRIIIKQMILVIIILFPSEGIQISGNVIIMITCTLKEILTVKLYETRAR